MLMMMMMIIIAANQRNRTSLCGASPSIMDAGKERGKKIPNCSHSFFAAIINVTFRCINNEFSLDFARLAAKGILIRYLREREIK